MNQRTTYEEWIAGKLEQIPVPDMADAIWARIEQQLNLDMPQQDAGGGNGGGKLPGFSTPGQWFLTALVAALIGMYLLKPSKPSTHIPAPDQHSSVPTTTHDSIAATAESTAVIRSKADIPIDSPPPEPSHETTGNATVNPPLEKEPIQEIKQPQEAVQQPLMNTVPNAGNQPGVTGKPNTVNSLVDTTVKKSRGVKGIGNGDYKITPVKKGQ
jgi:hypothetical protein